MKEYILSFLPSQFSNPDQFRVELAGITFPFKGYFVNRVDSKLYSLEYVIAGKGMIEVDGLLHEVKAGDSFLLPLGHQHRYWSDDKEPFHKIWVNVSGALCQQLMQTYQLQRQYVFFQTDTFNVLQRMLTACEKKGTTQERSATCALLFHEILLILAEGQPQQHHLVPSNIQAVKEYLDNHLQENVTLDELANVASLSPSQLTRQFKRYFQQTPYAYYLSKKIESAQLLLKETLLSVQEIAARLNFSDEHYFSNVFRQKTGMTPTAWRKK
ncbi:AraC family transcriptional regulator [Enterococcus sp. MJM12]|uniref:AraC family transcriptional regulator n=1 Tax=Candidatus Enterococcus myersii TaxID=2815322 RepID=A0ABS3HAI1_9ENTE|nr:AraC family transcriptional regulator [Enterococcus sp. MJM12]MBO0450047.1 AraC family transcriptional regulator [Enterococcus sp. MJM12]